MGDVRRFDLFAKVIAKGINKEARIADVAGGKGYLQLALKERGFRDITTWDKRSRAKIKIRYDYFRHDIEEDYDAVVALHPDEGTDHAILYAKKRGIPAIICPCCVKPSAVPYWGSRNYSQWLDHLVKLNPNVIFDKLKMNGRNDVLIY